MDRQGELLFELHRPRGRHGQVGGQAEGQGQRDDAKAAKELLVAQELHAGQKHLTLGGALAEAGGRQLVLFKHAPQIEVSLVAQAGSVCRRDVRWHG